MRFVAIAALAAKQSLVPYEFEPAAIGPLVEIQISHCGICHSDLHLSVLSPDQRVGRPIASHCGKMPGKS